MSRRVPPEGSPAARLVVIAEAPATHEVAQGRPLVGPSGQLWNRWLAGAGIARGDCYIDNVFPYQAPGNKIERVPRADLAPWVENLHERIAALEDPWLIVPMGNVALRALTGLNQVTKHRGSIYEYIDRRDRRIKVIPTIHPAAIFRTPKWERRCRADWVRVGGDRLFRERRVPLREHGIRPTIQDVRDYVADASTRADVLAIDIETPRETSWVEVRRKPRKDGTPGKARLKKVLGAPRITCVGFSFEPHFSLTIPTTLAYWHDQDTLDDVWDLIRQLCALPCEKVLQNGLFDAYYLADHGIDLTDPAANWTWDTLALHHALDPTDEHKLAYLASLDTREPYWKDDAKDEDDDEGSGWSEPSADGLDRYWTYNGKDAAVTRELADVYVSRVAARRLMGFYLDHYTGLTRPLHRIMRTGLAVNDRARRKHLAILTGERADIEDRLTAATGGVRLFGPKGALVPKRLADYLYGTLGLPRQIDRKTKGLTTKEVVIRGLMLRFPQRLGEAGGLILQHRRVAKLTEFYAEKALDPDGRLRSSYKFTTETGRLASSKNPKRTGRNAQNVDHDARAMYVPDPGCIFLEVDMSQAEDRLVKVLTGSDRLIARARSAPWENDEHRRAAEIIWPGLEITKDRRTIGKRTRHAGNYGMTGKTHSEQLLKDGHTFTPQECDKMIEAIIDKDTPEVRHWQAAVRRLIMHQRKLTDSWGAEWIVEFDRLDDDLYRRAYARIPQGEVARTLNQWGLRPVDAYIEDCGLKARVNQQGHDALLISTPPGDAWALTCFLKASLERERLYLSPVTGQRVALTIPVEFKIGRSWKADHEWKRLPSRSEFEDAVHGLPLHP